MKKDSVVTELNVNNNIVGIVGVNNTDYISITDLAKYANEDDPSGVIRNWMSNQNSYAFYSLWEEINICGWKRLSKCLRPKTALMW